MLSKFELYGRTGIRDLAEHYRALSRDTILKLANSLPAADPLRRTSFFAPAIRTILGERLSHSRNTCLYSICINRRPIAHIVGSKRVNISGKSWVDLEFCLNRFPLADEQRRRECSLMLHLQDLP